MGFCCDDQVHLVRDEVAREALAATGVDPQDDGLDLVVEARAAQRADDGLVAHHHAQGGVDPVLAPADHALRVHHDDPFLALEADVLPGHVGVGAEVHGAQRVLVVRHEAALEILPVDHAVDEPGVARLVGVKSANSISSGRSVLGDAEAARPAPAPCPASTPAASRCGSRARAASSASP